MGEGGEKPAAGVKRFYEGVSVGEEDGAFTILLDGRPAKTRGGRVLGAASRVLADAMADEWRAQGAAVAPSTMPLTGLQMTVLDLGAREADIWRRRVLDYLQTDLLCYRAEAPAALVARQAAVWDPYLDWLAETCGAAFEPTEGIMHAAQPAAAVAAAGRLLDEAGAAQLLSIRIITELTGSAVLAIALWRGRANADAVFAAARLDEDYQAEQWGRDAEAEARAERLRAEVDAAARFLELN